MQSRRLVLFGAGNVGRSFVAQLFARGGYEVVFVDVDAQIVDALNARGSYQVVIRDRVSETITVGGVRAVHAQHTEAVVRELTRTRLVATAVGAVALPKVMRVIAKGLLQRQRAGRPPFDVILAENLREAGDKTSRWLRDSLPSDFPQKAMPGLVETSIGKMVPITPSAQRTADPLIVYAEAYNTLILDKHAFRGELPDVAGLSFKTCMKAWVDRKLFMHNLGHALLCYLGFLRFPDADMLWQLLEDDELKDRVRAGMMEGACALAAEYPDEFSIKQLSEHATELIGRLTNRALGDTVYRVGRDIKRKLSRDERLVGALCLGDKHALSMPLVQEGIASGLFFRKADENGNLFAADEDFVKVQYPKGPRFVVEHVCGLSDHAQLAEGIVRKFAEIERSINR